MKGWIIAGITILCTIPALSQLYETFKVDPYRVIIGLPLLLLIMFSPWYIPKLKQWWDERI